MRTLWGRTVDRVYSKDFLLCFILSRFVNFWRMRIRWNMQDRDLSIFVLRKLLFKFQFNSKKNRCPLCHLKIRRRGACAPGAPFWLRAWIKPSQITFQWCYFNHFRIQLARKIRIDILRLYRNMSSLGAPWLHVMYEWSYYCLNRNYVIYHVQCNLCQIGTLFASVTI